MSSKKRVISSCIPCYTRKQKCSRQYPCNHCSRRQCAEDCVYFPNSNHPNATTSQSPSPARLPEHPTDERPRLGGHLLSTLTESEQGRGHDWNFETKPVGAPSASRSGLSLAESFGYFEDSSHNSLALAQKLGFKVQSSFPKSFVSDAAKEIHRNTERMPDGKILDFLVKYFIAEVNWMEQLVHVPWFLAKYQAWRTTERMVLFSDVEFTILVLRICSYATSFLPSPAYTLDKIRGVLLSDIRTMCEVAAENLEAISTAADSRGSVVRVQYLALLGLQYQVEGKAKAFWEVLSRAIRVAQDVGMDRLRPSSTTLAKGSEDDALERESECRTFCNLYIWDSLLSRQLDREPFLRGPLSPETQPRLHGNVLANKPEHMILDDADGAPDPFTERLLQADLADFWRRTTSSEENEKDDDMVAAEDRDERFYSDFVRQLPPVFALTEPDKAWDGRFSKLALQRTLLHIAIYDSMCWNLRPPMMRQPVPSLPAYKSVMLSCQKKKIAAAALHSLEAAAQLHVLLGSCHTRAAAIISSTFEASVILVYLVTNPTFLDGQRQGQQQSQLHAPLEAADPLQTRIGRVTHTACAAGIKAALRRLQMLAEASGLAEVAANVLSQLLKANGHFLGSDSFGSSEMDMAQDDGLYPGGGTDHTAPVRDNVNLTSPEMGAISTASWPYGSSPADIGLVDDLMSSLSPTVVGAEMAGWAGFEASNLNGQDVDIWGEYKGDGPHPGWNFSLSGG